MTLEDQKAMALDHLHATVNYAKLAYTLMNVKWQGFPHDPNCKVHQGLHCTCFKDEFDRRAKELKRDMKTAE